MQTLSSPRLQLVVGITFLAVMVGGMVDLYLDAPESFLTLHVVLEVALVVVSLGLGTYLLRGWYATARSLEDVRAELAERRAERDEWRQRARKLLEGLGREIDRQFEEWGLTPAEKEVALLLVKGYSHKKIAAMTDRSERTARQHASSVYSKAELSGRHQLTAFFLEDLMLPHDAEESSGPPDQPSGPSSGGAAPSSPG